MLYSVVQAPHNFFAGIEAFADKILSWSSPLLLRTVLFGADGFNAFIVQVSSLLHHEDDDVALVASAA